MTNLTRFVTLLTRDGDFMENRPKLCPNCRKLIGLEIVCPYCGSTVTSPKVRAQTFFRNSRVSQYGVAGALISFCLLIYTLVVITSLLTMGVSAAIQSLWSPEPQVMGLLGMNIYSRDPRMWWTLVTGIFLHAGFLHILFNMWALKSMGDLLEPSLGKRNFWIIFFICALSGSILTALKGNFSVGASNGIFGLMGSTLIISYVLGQGTQDPLFRSLLFWGGISLAMGFMPGSRFDNWGHIGGLIAGLIMGFVMVNLRPMKWWNGFSTFLSGLLLLSMIASYGALIFFVYKFVLQT